MLEIISRRRHRSLPIPINADVLSRASISPSLIPRTLQAFKILDLINDDGNPTDIFEAIRTCPESDYQRRLEEWLKGAYAEVFAFVDPTKDDEIKIRDAFRSYNPAGQQERMVTLFMGLCAAAGLTPEKTASAPRQPRSNPTPAQRQALNPLHKRIINNSNKFPTARMASVSLGLPPALSGLLESLPAAGNGWTKDERTKFLTTFQAVLDFCIPVVAAHPRTEDGGQP